MQIFSEECDTKKNNGGALFGGGALYGENTVHDTSYTNSTMKNGLESFTFQRLQWRSYCLEVST